MKRNLLTFVLALFIGTFAQAQLTQSQGFNYKALMTNNGNIMANQSITLRFNILKNGTTSVYSETQSATTDANGIVSVAIGEGNPISGSFTNINWGMDLYFLKVEINSGSGYQNFGTSELKAVPFAKFANYVAIADNIQGIPISTTFPTNGQILKFNGMEFVPSDDDISGGGSADGVVNSASFSGSTTKTLTLSRSNGMSNVTANFTDNVNDADHDATNEIQNLSINGNLLSISNGNSVTLPSSSGGASKIDDLSDAKSDSDGSNDGSSVFLGKYAGQNDDSSDNHNAGLGYNAMSSNTTGNNNIAVGYESMNHNSTGSKNTAIGSTALTMNSIGEENTATGYYALSSNTNGHDNVASGSEALKFNTTGQKNTAIGSAAMMMTTTAQHNTGVGFASLLNNTADNNTAIGSLAMYTNTSGSENTAVGQKSLYSNTTGQGNAALGWLAMENNTTGTANTAVGNSALNLSTTANNNTAIGKLALYMNQGNENVAVGSEVLVSNTTGEENVGVGYQSLHSNVSGHYNVGVGRYTLKDNSSGVSNVAVGDAALNITTGSYNVALGDSAYLLTADVDNTVCIGYNSGTGSANNRVIVGNSSMTWIGGQVTWSTFSDRRIKQNIHDDVVGLDFITKLRPVTYNLNIHQENKLNGKDKTADWKGKYDIENIKMTGFIAQEVEAAAQEAGYDFSGVQKEKDGLYSVSYAQFVMPLVKATQEQQKIIENQQAEIDTLKKLVNQLIKKEKEHTN